MNAQYAIFELDSKRHQRPTDQKHIWFRNDTFGVFSSLDEAKTFYRSNSVIQECPNAYLIDNASEFYIYRNV